jgi:hypothetical protein
MAQSAVSTVLGNVTSLAVQETKFLCGITLEVGFLKDELMRLQGYLRDADGKQRLGNEGAAILVGQIRAVSYEVESVIETADYMDKRNRLKKGFMGAISRYARLPTDLVALHSVGVEIQRVRRKLKEIFQSAECLKIDLNSTALVMSIYEDEFPQNYGLIHQSFEHDLVMFGFQDEYKEIVDILLGKENMLSAISIVAIVSSIRTKL